MVQLVLIVNILILIQKDVLFLVITFNIILTCIVSLRHKLANKPI